MREHGSNVQRHLAEFLSLLPLSQPEKTAGHSFTCSRSLLCPHAQASAPVSSSVPSYSHGGRAVAWLRYVSESRAAITSVTATATAHAVAALQPFPANGSATRLKSTTTATQQEGSNKILSMMQQGVITGDIMGSYTNDEDVTLASDNTRTFSGRITCSCTVSGKSGTLMWSYTGTQAANGSVPGTRG
jgi:triacylglycerol esterase/lipase EstA (alpha/beta hydrolase family)